LWDALISERSGVAELTTIPTGSLPTKYGAEARGFTGAIEEFGPLEKLLGRNIKKNLRVMCREIQMGVAVAQLCLSNALIKLDDIDRDRLGVVYGSDYLMTLPGEFAAGVRKCLDAQGHFDFTQWAEQGLAAVEPLWLLKYLPNLPAVWLLARHIIRSSAVTPTGCSPAPQARESIPLDRCMFQGRKRWPPAMIPRS
jgi:3-oxoacyl-[acyl-carrier-protein] synthase II